MKTDVVWIERLNIMLNKRHKRRYIILGLAYLSVLFGVRYLIISDFTYLADIFSDISRSTSEVSGGLLATVSGGRFIHVREGMRKEEIGELFASKLNWSDSQKLAFLSGPEGRYYPGTYSVSSNKDEEVMRELMLHRFDREVETPYASSSEMIISMPIALKIASLIEREAGGKSDMRLISGIIWNRIFDGMKLDIDATLQYMKGSARDGWWPVVLSSDKKIDSPYNTYKYRGFPPTPISNPGLASIDAALHPKKTSCLFYLHDKHRRIHCATTYKGHVANIKRYLK